MTTPADALIAAWISAAAWNRCSVSNPLGVTTAAPARHVPVFFGLDISRDGRHAAVAARNPAGGASHIYLIGQTMPDVSFASPDQFRELVEAALPGHAHVAGTARKWNAVWSTPASVFTIEHCITWPASTTKLAGPNTTVLLNRPTAENVIAHLRHMGAIELTDEPDTDELGPEHVWIGDMAGFTIGADGDRALLAHRCGHMMRLGRDEFLGDVVQQALAHRSTGCQADLDAAAAGFYSAEKVKQRVVHSADGTIRITPPEPVPAAEPAPPIRKPGEQSQLAELIGTWLARYRTGTYAVAQSDLYKDCRAMLFHLEEQMEQLARANAQLTAAGNGPFGQGATLTAPMSGLMPGGLVAYMMDYRDHWADLIEPGGVLDRDQLARELCDYRTMMSEVSTVYAELTGGAHGQFKPHHRADSIVAAVEARFAATYARHACNRAQTCQDQNKYGASVLRKLAEEWHPGAWDRFRESLGYARQPLASGGIVHSPVINEMSAGFTPSPAVPIIHIADGQPGPTAALHEAIEGFAERRLRHGDQ